MTNFSITFSKPWLLLLLLVPAALLTLIPYFRLNKRYRCTRNRIASMALHVVIMVLAISLLAGLAIDYDLPNDKNEVILLVDASFSEEALTEEKNQFIKAVVDSNNSAFKLGIVTFGYDQVYAAELTKDIEDPLKMVEKVYDYVVKTLSYDKEKAKTVKSGYLPVLDTILSEKKGICFDYASLMTAMLRSQGVPCKLVIGYAGTAYHAWITVWSEDTGWVDGVIYFDGSTWHRMDPTFASSGNQSSSIMEYIGNGANYSAKYLY